MTEHPDDGDPLDLDFDAEPELDAQPSEPNLAPADASPFGMPMGSRIQEGEWLCVEPDESPFDSPLGGDDLEAE